MTKIALLGAGWLGEPLAHQLQTTGYQVQCSTTSADKAARLQTAGLASTVLQVTPTGIRGSVDDFFAADILILTLPPGGRSNPAVATDYPAKVRHLIAAAQAGKIQHVLFTSSTGVYGDTDGWVSEDDVLRPNTPSGQALQVVEQELRAAFGARLTILRLAGLAGADRQPGRWFAGRQNLLDGQVGGEPGTPTGRHSHHRTPTYQPTMGAAPQRLRRCTPHQSGLLPGRSPGTGPGTTYFCTCRGDPQRQISRQYAQQNGA